LIASQLSFNLIAIVIRSHHNCHSIASQLSFNHITIAIQSHRNCHLIASQLPFDFLKEGTQIPGLFI